MVDEELIDWFRATFPEASIWYAINELLRELKLAVDEQPPVNYYKVGARNLLTKLQTDLKTLEPHE